MAKRTARDDSHGVDFGVDDDDDDDTTCEEAFDEDEEDAILRFQRRFDWEKANLLAVILRGVLAQAEKFDMLLLLVLCCIILSSLFLFFLELFCSQQSNALSLD